MARVALHFSLKALWVYPTVLTPEFPKGTKKKLLSQYISSQSLNERKPENKLALDIIQSPGNYFDILTPTAQSFSFCLNSTPHWTLENGSYVLRPTVNKNWASQIQGSIIVRNIISNLSEILHVLMALTSLNDWTDGHHCNNIVYWLYK